MNKLQFDSRIKETPYYQSWYNSTMKDFDYSIDYGNIDYSNLSEVDSLILYIYAWNKTDIYPNKKGILKHFNWTNYKLQKVIKQAGIIFTEATFCERTGLLSGSGYVVYFNN